MDFLRLVKNHIHCKANGHDSSDIDMTIQNEIKKETKGPLVFLFQFVHRARDRKNLYITRTAV